jgi:prepilin-type N-terminal cleavage/methylation domain-containing protein
MKKAFTLIELIFVIIILGIVGMIGSDIIAKMYQGYLKSQITNRLQAKTELLLDVISQRLKYRIKESVIGRNSHNNNYMKLSDDNIASITPDMIEWIGYDRDSLIGESNGTYSVPGWSGFVDVNSSQTTTTGASPKLLMPGSKLSIANRVISTLSNNNNIMNNTHKRSILYSKCEDDSNMSRFGWDIPATLPSSAFDNNATIKVYITNTDTTSIRLAANKGSRDICEQYLLAWTAYAIVPEGNNTKDFNLTLRYNYQPWNGENYADDGTSVLLAEHVSTFRAMQVGDSIRIKVCIQDGNITGTPYGFCKEKAIY